MNDFRKALLIVWLIVAGIGSIAVAAPLMIEAEALHGLFPTCEARARNSRCAACGLTTGFIAIGEGRLADANDANAGSIPLYAGFSLNFAAAVAYSIKKLRSGGKACKS